MVTLQTQCDSTLNTQCDNTLKTHMLAYEQIYSMSQGLKFDLSVPEQGPNEIWIFIYLNTFTFSEKYDRHLRCTAY